MGEIRDAMERSTERKQALIEGGVWDPAAGGGRPRGEDVDERAQSLEPWLNYPDVELDVDELEEVSAATAAAGVVALMRGMPARHVIAGCWADGVVTGLIIAGARAAKGES